MQVDTEREEKREMREEDDTQKINETERVCKRKIGSKEKKQGQSYTTILLYIIIFLHFKYQLGLFSFLTALV